MFNACRSFRGIDLHPANGIVLFSLLHLSIVTQFTHINLCFSVQRDGPNPTGHCAVIGIILPCIQTTEIVGDSPRSGEQ